MTAPAGLSVADVLAGWIEWSGGARPVAPSALVERRYRYAPDFNRTSAPADMWRWEHTGSDHDIVAYRITENCKWCAGQAWYTSWSGGFAHRMPCDYCNSDGALRPDPALRSAAEAARAQVQK